MTQITGLVAIEIGTTYITVRWDSQEVASAYLVYIKQTDSVYTISEATPFVTFSFSGLKPSTSYSIKVVPGDYYFFDETKNQEITVVTLAQDTSLCASILECEMGTYAIIDGECICICDLQCEGNAVVNSTRCSCNYCQDQSGLPGKLNMKIKQKSIKIANSFK